MWTIPKEWPGETAFIIAGGPSVPADAATLLRGRRVIVINSSHQLVPEADFLFFGDSRWWNENRRKAAGFAGRIVSLTGVTDPRVLIVRRYDVKVGLSLKPDGLVMGRTSLQAAINLAFLLGSRRIVLLGADMGPAPDGRTHHHEPHPWPLRPGCWDEQMQFLKYMVEPLKAAGVEVLNASPVSRIPWWPKVRLEDEF